ncbi:CBS domain-containing protein [Streptomyces sp. NPDC001984]|uniref:CBS domain-containing protein n=1 Tax=Streptomyces sp. NPDC002619 TaxID=3364655 RepID=UPI0036B84E3F
MAQRVRDIMSDDLVTVEPQAAVAAVARLMRDQDVGAVLVTEDGRLPGLVSDRDLVVCAFAEGTDPERTTVARACRGDLITITADDSLDQAVGLMREHTVRRLPVVDDADQPIGIASLGDLAIERDENSALGDISAARPNM